MGVAHIPAKPTPGKLLKEAKAEQHQQPYDLLDYGGVVDTLYRKGFSYAKIAKWLSVRLEGEIDRGQVFYIYKKWLRDREAAENHKFLLEQENGSSEDPLSAEFPPDPELDKFLQESDKRRLNAEADKEDSKRRAKSRKRRENGN